MKQLEDYFIEHKFDREKFKNLDELQAFTLFYQSLDFAKILNWMEAKTIENTLPKDNQTSIDFRQLGNTEFIKNKINSNGLKYYTRSLSFAEFESSEYAITLANRSAVSFANKDYEDCVKDINLCLQSGKYPEHLKHKVLIRKLECYSNMQLVEKFNIELEILESDLKENALFAEFKKKYVDGLNLNKSSDLRKNSIDEELPIYKKNENFLYSSDNIELKHNNKNGRFVSAKEDIEPREILFVEPAFVVAPIFHDPETLVTDKCYHCLKYTKIPIPCKSCTLCLYCNESCRDTSWETDHRYECPGMVLWYDLGIGLPAFKCICKGLNSNFKSINNDDIISSIFGDFEDNYSYFHSLLSHFDKASNVEFHLLISSAIVLYLREKTVFFENLKEIITPDDVSVDYLIGGLLVKHIGQLTCNSSIVMHDTRDRNGRIVVEEEKTPVACGIFPSISMMNHSCDSNIDIRYLNDFAIVTAKVAISKGAEITNCYGVDYKTMSKKERQKALKQLYYFKCECLICRDPSKEIVF